MKHQKTIAQLLYYILISYWNIVVIISYTINFGLNFCGFAKKSNFMAGQR